MVVCRIWYCTTSIPLLQKLLKYVPEDRRNPEFEITLSAKSAIRLRVSLKSKIDWSVLEMLSDVEEAQEYFYSKLYNNK